MLLGWLVGWCNLVSIDLVAVVISSFLWSEKSLVLLQAMLGNPEYFLFSGYILDHFTPNLSVLITRTLSYGMIILYRESPNNTLLGEAKDRIL